MSWTYASLTVIDGQRRLKPAAASCDFLRFAQPPHLTSPRVEIILENGDAHDHHCAAVLPHSPDAIRIPIRLLPASEP